MMARKAATDGGKYNDIVSAAYKCFFEKGYDATSVRSIMTRAGGEIGLFYYYFDSKDDVFDRVLDRFFAHYEADFASIVAHGRRNPCRVMQDFFEYMECKTEEFRAEYAAKLHRTVRWAIREHTLELIEPYLLQIVEIQSTYYCTAPAIAPEVAAMYLTHGVGSSILHEDAKGYFARRREVKRGISLLMGMPMDDQELRIPYPANQNDIPGWMALVHEVKSAFPGFNEAEYAKGLEGYIERGEAWVIRYEDKIAAALLFSKERRELDFLAVMPEYRRRSLAGRLVETAAAQFPVGTELTVMTYREGDPLGESARAFYTLLGFVPGEEVTTFGYPCQKLILTIPDGTPARKK